MAEEINLEGFAYPDGIYTPKDMIDYVASVYGIKDENNQLLYATFKKVCALALQAEYSGWFEDYFDEWIKLESNS